ncbi:MAG: hypothetical protein ACYCW6_23365 [Candidatus Xenobia bacterium]
MRGVRKYRSIEAMNEDQKPVVETDPHRLLERLANLHELSRRLCPRLYRGVHKFRTLEKHEAFRQAWEAERH